MKLTNDFLYGKTIRAGKLSALVAPGWAEAETLAMAEATAMALGRPLLAGDASVRPLRVMFYGLNGPQCLSDAFEAARAAGKHPAREVFFRAAYTGIPDAPVIFVNLMDGAGQGVRIDRDGWQIMDVKDMPVPLADRVGARPLPAPVRAADGLSFMDRLERHLPLVEVKDPKDPDDAGVRQRAVLLTWLMGQFIRTQSGVPHLGLVGEQGSGKTTTARRLKDLTDPDADDSSGGIGDDVLVTAGQSSNIVLDNSSGIKGDVADVLCRLATGGTGSKRVLYTDGDRKVFRVLCSVILTSVLDGGVTRRSDLLDRMLTLHTQPLPKGPRTPGAVLSAAWEEDRPALLADLLDLVVVGLRSVGIVQAGQIVGLVPHGGRFPDVELVAEGAACWGLGWSSGRLMHTLDAVKADEATGQLEDDPIAFRLRLFLEGEPGKTWAGAYGALESQLRYMPVASGSPEWPQGLKLKYALPRIKPVLREQWGIEVAAHHTNTVSWQRFMLRDPKAKAA